MYGVVVCPRCKRAKGVNLRQKTTACACGFEIRVVPARVVARAATARELRPLVGRANAELGGGLEAVRRVAEPRARRRARDAHARVIAAAAEGDRARRVHKAAVELTRELEVFSVEDWKRVLEGMGMPKWAEALEELLADNAVYEPRPGFYRAVRLTP